MRGGWVYILANRYRGTIYIGVTADLAARTDQHRRKANPTSFTARYDLSRLVHAEPFERIEEAIAREKALKHWRRAWKIGLIEENNPDWLDLSNQLIGL